MSAVNGTAMGTSFLPFVQSTASLPTSILVRMPRDRIPGRGSTGKQPLQLGNIRFSAANPNEGELGMAGGATFNVRLQGQQDGSSIELCQQAEGGPLAGLRTVGSVSLKGVVESANRSTRAKGVITSTIKSFEGINREQRSKSAKIMAVPSVTGPPSKRARTGGGIGRKSFPNSTRGSKIAVVAKSTKKPVGVSRRAVSAVSAKPRPRMTQQQTDAWLTRTELSAGPGAVDPWLPDDSSQLAGAGVEDSESSASRATDCDLSALAYAHIKDSMEAIAAGLQSLHAARTAASAAGIDGERRRGRIDALLHDGCRVLDPLYRGLHDECTELLQCMLDKAGSKINCKRRN